VLAQGEPEFVLLGGLTERADDISLRSGGNGVPTRLMLRVPKIESVVMNSHAAKVFCSGLFVETQQMVGVELVSRPLGNQILETDPRRMTVGLQVILVLLIALDVHVTGVPVAVFHGGLRSPVRPDAELGITIPVGNLPLAKRRARPAEGAGAIARSGFGVVSWAAERTPSPRREPAARDLLDKRSAGAPEIRERALLLVILTALLPPRHLVPAER